MTFGLPGWLKLKYGDMGMDTPIWYPTLDRPDDREWLVTNGLGGYASSTVCGANIRRYHGLLVAPLNMPTKRQMIFTRVDERVEIDGQLYELSSNYWSSGVVAPTGYRFIESFTVIPVPTWVFNLNGHYLVKQLAMPYGQNNVHIAYFWLPDPDQPYSEAKITTLFLNGFRSFHNEVRGFADRFYPQKVEDNGTVLVADRGRTELALTWNQGEYEQLSQWWWNYYWPKEGFRDLPDHEDLFLFGSLTSNLSQDKPLYLQAAIGEVDHSLDFESVVHERIDRQKALIKQAGFAKSRENNALVLASDQFIVSRMSAKKVNDDVVNLPGKTIIAGYPWFNDAGRSAMISLPGLALTTRRYDDAKLILQTFSNLQHNGLIPNRFVEELQDWEYISADTTLWWAWALFQYVNITGDGEFAREQFPYLKIAAEAMIAGTEFDIRVDARDGLLACGTKHVECTWMDAKVQDYPITSRSGKPVEVNALWYNFLEILSNLAERLGEDIGYIKDVVHLTQTSMQKFWNSDQQCLYDVIEPGHKPTASPISALRPNQVLAVSLPFRAFSKIQEKAILNAVDKELLTPYGLRSLSPLDHNYQGQFGCGLSRCDQYHRDLSYHQGCVWPWLLGHYCEALLNVYGPIPETYAKIQILLQPILHHMNEDVCLGNISELFNGDSPHIARGCIAQAWSVAEILRAVALVSKRSIFVPVK